MIYDLNIREESFGATLTNVKNGKREYVTKDELVNILNHEKLPQDIAKNIQMDNYNIKFTPLNNNEKYLHFSFADIVYMELTRECNLRCLHCLNNSGVQLEKQLSLCEFKKIIQELSNAGIQEIRFTGGEPLKFEGIIDLIKLATDNGICTSLGTNGTLITKDVAYKLKNAGLKKAVISIDGTQKKHDIIRGKGNYVKAISGLNHLKDAGIDVRVNAVIMKSNIEDVIELAKELNNKKIKLFIRRFIESGRGEKLKDNMLSEKDYNYVRERLKDEIQNSPFVNGHYLRNDEGIHPRIKLPFEIRGCKAGQRAIAIMPDGEIQLCGFLAAQNFPGIDNVRNIKNWREFWNNIQKMDKLKNLRINLDKYNKQDGVQETYCLAYIQRYLNCNKE